MTNNDVKLNTNPLIPLPCREAFELMTCSDYEGNFAQYPDGEYVNDNVNEAWYGFRKGWQAALTTYIANQEKGE